MESKVLGKGLSALISERSDNTNTTPQNVSLVKTKLIKNNSLQPRSNYDESKLAELIASIKEKGMLQPILIRQSGDGYEVIAGERRLRAARALNLDEIPAVVKTVTDREALILALVENIQREDLNAVEEAQSYRKLLDEFKFTHDEIAKSVGKNRATISNTLRLLKLSDEIQNAIADGAISEGHARALLGLEDAQLQKQIYEMILKQNLSVRETEKKVRDLLANFKTADSAKATKNYEVAALEENLREVFGTKVQILHRNKKGKIVIDYYSLDDLDRILGIIKK